MVVCSIYEENMEGVTEVTWSMIHFFYGFGSYESGPLLFLAKNSLVGDTMEGRCSSQFS